MKRLFTFLTAMLMIVSSSSFAEKVANGKIRMDVAEHIIPVQPSNRHNAPMSLQASGAIYDDAAYVSIQKTSSTYYKIEIMDSDGYSNLCFKNVELTVGATNNINGGYLVPRYGQYKSSDETFLWGAWNSNTAYMWNNPSGAISFRYTGSKDSDGDPIYTVFIFVDAYRSGNYGYNQVTFDFQQDLAVAMFDTNGQTRLTIDNSFNYTDVSIPGCFRLTDQINSDGRYLIQGSNETWTAYFQTKDGYASKIQGSWDNTDLALTQSSLIRRSDNNEIFPNVIHATTTYSNGFYFLDAQYCYANTIARVTMQYPNYQANDTTFTDIFTTDNTTIVRSADYATSGIVTLTAKNTNTHKGVRMDFVVDKSSATDSKKIPAGTYSVSTSKETNTVVASPGINQNLTINNSFAGPLNNNNDFYVNTSTTLWCFRTGTDAIVVDYIGDKMRVRATNINRDYRSSAVNFSILPTYTITYRDKDNADFSGVHGSDYPTTHTYGTPTNLVSPTKEGCNFLGWYDNADCTGDTLTTIGATAKTADFTLYAKWEVAARTVTITAPTGGTITVTDGTTTITSGSQAYSPDITITLTATPDTDYEFVSWNSGTPELADETTEDGVVSGTFTLTDSTTVGATFRRVHYDELTLLDNESADHYNTFATQYNGVKVDEVTYERTFAVGRWSTVCLPFTVAVEEIDPVWEQVYEFVRATGDADLDGDGMMLYFRKATTIEAGKCYLVYNTGVSDISSTTFTDVTINTTADKADITSLEGYKDEGDISLVGTLRKDTLPAKNHTYMALSNNTIYWPGNNGITVRAYRGFFKDANPTPTNTPQRVRIVVEGEVATDLEIMENGELRMDNAEVRKYIDNGVLIIERNGVKYDAQGKKIEN